ncbi:hypothetical protein FB45DRAFT_871493, partial [Roridomyces roridus]
MPSMIMMHLLSGPGNLTQNRGQPLSHPPWLKVAVGPLRDVGAIWGGRETNSGHPGCWGNIIMRDKRPHSYLSGRWFTVPVKEKTLRSPALVDPWICSTSANNMPFHDILMYKYTLTRLCDLVLGNHGPMHIFQFHGVEYDQTKLVEFLSAVSYVFLEFSSPMDDNESRFYEVDLHPRTSTLTHQLCSNTMVGPNPPRVSPLDLMPSFSLPTLIFSSTTTLAHEEEDIYNIEGKGLGLEEIRTFASSAPSSAVQAIRAHFHLSAEVSYLITFTFLMGNVLGHSSGAQEVKERRRANPEGSKRLYAAHEKQDWSPWGIVKRTLFRPFIMLSQELILVLVTIYLSLIYGVMYMLFEAFPIIFVEKHGFTISQNGLVFIGVGIGTVLGALSTHFLATDYPQLIK